MPDKKKTRANTKRKSATAPRGRSAPKRSATPLARARAAAFTDESPSAAFEHFRPLAEQVPLADLPVFTGQPLIMRANVRAALEVMEPHLDTAAALLPGARLRDVLELPALVMALDFAAGRVPVAKLSTGEIEQMLSEGAPWRDLMLTYLEIASHPLLALLPRERVAAIRTGKGKLDQAKDFVAVPGLFAEFETTLAGKHPFPADKLDLIGILGGALIQHMRPTRAPTEIRKRTTEALLRDRFAALVTARYDHLQVLATVALGKREADRLLPALRSAIAVSFTSEADAAPAPASAGTSATLEEKTPA